VDQLQFEARKRDHIRLSMDPAHQAEGLSGLDRVRLVHEALPELDLDQVDISAACLGRELATPFFVAGMTAGHADAPALNRLLALACERRGWAMGVGSQRRQLEQPGAGASPDLDQWRRLREDAPKLSLFANIGVTQLHSTPVRALRALVEAISADALVIHLNALQECIQPEGTPRFSGATEAIRRVVGELGSPVILKETGCGLSARTLARIAPLGLAAVDVSGLGGTHWGRIEGSRAAESGRDRLREEVSRTFADWGVSTVDSVLASASALSGSKTSTWASGGVRSGLDAAKLLALGASRVGYAQPALLAAMAGADALSAWMERQELELRTAMFCTGSATVAELRRGDGVWIKS
jgi:isopentenyl-diphosphate delta-isomerase